MFGSSVSLIWCHFHSCYLSNCLFAEKFSNCSNSLNFEAKINCNSIKSNVPKWRKICIGLKFDLVHFNGPQTKFKNIDNFGGPCRLLIFHSPRRAGPCRRCSNINIFIFAYANIATATI